MSDTNEIQIDFDELIDRILVVPCKKYSGATADFIFGKYTVNLDLRKACCEKYYIYLNGKDFTLDKKCVSGDSKTVFESSRTKRAPEHSETVLPFLNGGSHKYNNTVIKIKPSSSVTFTFGEKTYHHRKDWCFTKNYMIMKFSGGDRIRTNRDEQYDGPTYANVSRAIRKRFSNLHGPNERPNIQKR